MNMNIYLDLPKSAKWFLYRVSIHHPLGFKDGTPCKEGAGTYIYKHGSLDIFTPQLGGGGGGFCPPVVFVYPLLN